MDFERVNIKKALKARKKFINSHLNQICSMDGLVYEKGIVASSMDGMQKSGIKRYTFVEKNEKKSIELRNQGNTLYGRRVHNDSVHRSILRFYSESIAFAPNDSEELALGYGNRSALMFHMKQYEECIQDCDRSISITNSDFLKSKLLFRKIESLVALEKSSTKTACKEALVTFEQLDINQDVKAKFIEKLNDILKSIEDKVFEEKAIEVVVQTPLPFTPNPEAPCSSTAIKISYSQALDRHITATQNINPGEILVIEKSYHLYLHDFTMYLFCSHCVKPSWNPVPCEHCVFDVYCSEKCRSEAWKIYHQFECPIYPYMYDKEQDLSMIYNNLRFLLISVHKAGGIDNLNKNMEAVAMCKDPRTKGFTKDKVFTHENCRSVLWQPNKDGQSDFMKASYLAQDACYATYFLATKTTFFGKKYTDLKPMRMISEPEMLFFAAMLYKNFFSTSNYALGLKVHKLGMKSASVGITIHPFCSLIKHSCGPNAETLINNNNEMIVYAKNPIKKGEQVTIQYYDTHFLLESKPKRKVFLESAFRYECKCLPCLEDWSCFCLPPLKELVQSIPELDAEMEQVLDKANKIEMELRDNNFEYDLNLAKELVDILKSIGEKVTVNCEEYLRYEFLLKSIYTKSFAKTFLDIPETC